MNKYKKLFKAGNKAQLQKLKENEYKNGWDDIPIGFAINRLDEELKELDEALFKEYPINYKAVRREAADIANFAHMIILKCDKEIVSLEENDKIVEYTQNDE